MNWLSLLTPLVIAAAGIAHVLVQRSLKKPSDAERAALLESIAQGAAATVVALNPNAPWADLVQQVVNAISGTPSVPTSNADALQRAASAALARLVPNKLPAATKPAA